LDYFRLCLAQPFLCSGKNGITPLHLLGYIAQCFSSRLKYHSYQYIGQITLKKRACSIRIIGTSAGSLINYHHSALTRLTRLRSMPFGPTLLRCVTQIHVSRTRMSCMFVSRERGSSPGNWFFPCRSSKYAHKSVSNISSRQRSLSSPSLSFGFLVAGPRETTAPLFHRLLGRFFRNFSNRSPQSESGAAGDPYVVHKILGVIQKAPVQGRLRKFSITNPEYPSCQTILPYDFSYGSLGKRVILDTSRQVQPLNCHSHDVKGKIGGQIAIEAAGYVVYVEKLFSPCTRTSRK
jgi:hypothetical protein